MRPRWVKLEAGAVFQAEAERAVDADMRRPDQRDPDQIERRQQEARDRERDRHEQDVHRVVGDGARPRAEEIGGEAHVRHKDERGEAPPVRADAVIQVHRAERDRRAFEPQQQARHPSTAPASWDTAMTFLPED